MQHQWETFLADNKGMIFEKYIEAILPKLAGVLLYHFYSSDSFAEYSSFCDEEAQSAESFRSVTSYYHHEQFTLYYVKKNLSEESTLDEWLSLHHFVEHNGEGDWNLPNTWNDTLLEWLSELRDYRALGEILDSLVDPSIKEFFHRLNRPHDNNDKNIWQQVYLNDLDEAELSFFMSELELSVLPEFISKLTFKTLKDSYSWFYLSYRSAMEKKNLANMRDHTAREKLRDETLKNGMKLIPEFRRRLATQCGLIVPQLRFAKDIEFWPHLKMILETFSSKERTAIIFASDCSLSVKQDYLHHPSLH